MQVAEKIVSELEKRLPEWKIIKLYFDEDKTCEIYLGCDLFFRVTDELIILSGKGKVIDFPLSNIESALSVGITFLWTEPAFQTRLLSEQLKKFSITEGVKNTYV